MKPIFAPYKPSQIDIRIIETKKMNFKLFTTALLATGATAAYTSEQSAGAELKAKYQAMPEHVQRRFWARIL